mmetsp:Transcript_13899/g.43429  ORF Transcript_13899/g.43429 Transcript_13899/m.43429 type:complete len:209 (+) Transcript_13899:478-1104(+)
MGHHEARRLRRRRQVPRQAAARARDARRVCGISRREGAREAERRAHAQGRRRVGSSGQPRAHWTFLRLAALGGARYRHTCLHGALYSENCARLEALQQPRGRRAHRIVHLARRRAEDERADCIARHSDVRDRAEDVHLLVGEHDARARRVLDREFRFAVLAGDAPDRAAEVIAVQQLHVRHVEGLDEEVVEPQERERVRHVEAEHEGL